MKKIEKMTDIDSSIKIFIGKFKVNIKIYLFFILTLSILLQSSVAYENYKEKSNYKENYFDFELLHLNENNLNFEYLLKGDLGTYEVNFALRNEKITLSKNEIITLNNSQGQIFLLKFDNELIENGEYFLDIKILKNGKIYYQNKNSIIVTINNNINNDNNSFNLESIQFSFLDERLIQIDNLPNLNFSEVYVLLKSENDYKLVKTENNLFQKEFNSIVGLICVKNNTKIFYKINFELPNFEEVILDNFEFIEIDENQNSIFENLSLNFSIFVDKESNYKIELELEDFSGKYLDTINLETYLYNILENKISLNIPTKNLFKNSNTNGIKIKNIKIKENNIILLKKENIIESRTYFFNEFENLNLADLFFEYFNYNQSDGTLNFTIKNMGNFDSLPFKIEIISDNFAEIINQDILKSNENISFIKNIGINKTYIYVFSDFDKKIEEINEENNLFKFPHIIEIDEKDEKNKNNSKNKNQCKEFKNIGERNDFEFQKCMHSNKVNGNEKFL